MKQTKQSEPTSSSLCTKCNKREATLLCACGKHSMCDKCAMCSVGEDKQKEISDAYQRGRDDCDKIRIKDREVFRCLKCKDKLGCYCVDCVKAIKAEPRTFSEEEIEDLARLLYIQKIVEPNEVAQYSQMQWNKDNLIREQQIMRLKIAISKSKLSLKSESAVREEAVIEFLNKEIKRQHELVFGENGRGHYVEGQFVGEDFLRNIRDKAIKESQKEV